MDSREIEHDKKCYEYHRQKYLKLQEQLKNEQDKAHENTREYYQMLQKGTDKAQRVRIQAVYGKQRESIGKAIAHLTRKIETTRKKVNDAADKLPDRIAPQKVPSQNGLNMGQEAGARDQPEMATVIQLAVPRNSGNNMMCTSRFGSDTQLAEEETGSGEDGDSKSGSNRASLVEVPSGLQLDVLSTHSEGKGESRDSLPAPSSMDNLMQNLISDETLRIEERINALTERLDKHEGDIEKIRTDSISNNSHNRENTEQLEERSKQLETDFFECSDNQQLEIQQLKNQINELYEKFEYDSRRLQREFTEKMENVYECIEKLELGRNDQNGNIQNSDYSISGDFREAMANIFIGMIGLLLYIISTFQNIFSPLTRTTSRTLLSLLIVLLSVICYYFKPELLPIFKRFLQPITLFKQ